MMKEDYKRPQVVSDGIIVGVIPAGLVAATGAFTAGVAAGVGLRKLLSDGMSWNKGKSLVEEGADA